MKRILLDMLIIIGNVICLTDKNNNIRWLNITAIVLLAISVIHQIVSL